MIVWCMLIVVANIENPVTVETAAKGIVKAETGSHYTVDFSKYAKDQRYHGDYSEVTLSKDYCTEAK